MVISFVLPFLLIIPTVHLFQLTHRFSPSLTWVNSLDTLEDLVDYLKSDHRLARVTVNEYKRRLIMGNNTNFLLSDCIKHFMANQSSHFLLIHVQNNSAYQQAQHLLLNFKSNRLGLLAQTELGPNNIYINGSGQVWSQVTRKTVYQALWSWPPHCRLAIGWITGVGPVNSYSRWQLRYMYHALSYYENIQRLQFIIEFEAFYLSHKFNLIENIEQVKTHNWLVVIIALNMTHAVDFVQLRKAIVFIGPQNVYLNVPDEMRKIILLDMENPAVAVAALPFLTISFSRLLLVMWKINDNFH